MSLSTTSAGSFIKNAGGTSKGLTFDNVSATSPYINFKLLSSEAMRITSTGNVGIGTTSPGAKLDVNGNIKIANNGKLYSDQSLSIDIDGSSSGSSRFFSVTHNNSASELFRVQENGNVGIGTTSPVQLFEVNGGSGQLITTDSHQRLFITSSPLHQSILYFGDTNSNSQGRVAYDNNFDDMYFNTAAAERMRIKSNGNVGIGTTSPVSKLELQDGTFTVDNGNINVIAGGISATRNSANNTGLVVNQQGTADILNLLDNGTEVLTVIDGGNVGIGTTSPSEKLDVVGNIKLRGTNNLTIGSTSSGGNFSLSSGIRGFNFANNNGDLVRIDSDGNVGIGTTSPSSPLHIEFNSSSTTFPAGAGDYLQVENANTTINTHSSIALRSGTADSFISTVYKGVNIGDLVFNLDNGGVAEKMRILANGNVGIGTTSPSTTLDVAGSITTSGALIGPSLFEIIAQYANRGRITLSSSTSTGANQIALLTSGVARMVVNKEGNVGIGTTSPGQKLHVAGGIARFSNVASNYIEIDGSASGSNHGIISARLNQLQLKTNAGFGDPHISILPDTGGNVGIGTASPTSKLEVAGGDIELSDVAGGITMISPDGTRYRITVANGGTLTVTAA